MTFGCFIDSFVIGHYQRSVTTRIIAGVVYVSMLNMAYYRYYYGGGR